MSKLSPRVKILTVFLLVMISFLIVYPSLQKYYYERDNLYKGNTNLEVVLAQTDIESMSDELLTESARVLTFDRHSKELEPYLLEMEKRPAVNRDYLFFISEDHLNNFRYDEALDILEESVQQFPDHPVAAVRYTTLMILSNPEKALKILKEVTDIPQENAVHYKGIIKTVEQFVSLKAQSEVKAYEHLLNSELPASAPVRILYLENLLKGVGSNENANYSKYYIELGNLYSIYGYREKALAAYRNVLDQSGSVSGYIGLEYFKNEDRDGISRLLNSVVKDSSEEYMLLGIRAYLEGNYKDASEWYEKSLQKDENNLVSHYLAVYSYHQMGSKKKAVNQRVLFIEAYNKGELPFSFEYYGDLLNILSDKLRTVS